MDRLKKESLDSVQDFIIKISEGSETEIAKEVVTSVNFAFHNEGYDWVNNVLATHPSKLCRMSCVSLLRITFSKRNQLPNWPIFLNNVHNHFKQLGLDVSLRGLYP